MRNDFFKYLLIHGRKKSVESETFPMTFKAKRTENLKNYRIYGNTVNGESVGDKTINLAKWDNNLTVNINGNISTNPTSCGSVIDTHLIDNLYLFGDAQKLNSGIYRIGKYNTYPKSGDTGTRFNSTGGVIDVSDCNYCLISCNLYGTQTTRQNLLNEFMIIEGNTAPAEFEPYGYKIPVTLTAGSAETTNIYLDTPLAKSGNNADYIDYMAQKRHNSDGTESTVTLPEIAVTAGTNTLTVETEVQPSKVYLQGHISRGGSNAE